MSPPRSPRAVIAILVLTTLVAGSSACRAPMREPAPVVAKGPDFQRSFEAVQAAMIDKGYLIARADKADGIVETERRTQKDLSWSIAAKVAPDGTVTFAGSGSEQLQQGTRIHPRLLRWVELVKRAFESRVVQAQTIRT